MKCLTSTGVQGTVYVCAQTFLPCPLGEMARPTMGLGLANRAHRSIHPMNYLMRLFYFCIFQKKNLQKYIFGFRFYSFVPPALPSGRGAAGGLPSGREAVGTYM